MADGSARLHERAGLDLSLYHLYGVAVAEAVGLYLWFTFNPRCSFLYAG